MNNEEAKFLLRGYRSDGSDAQEAAFRPALDQVGRDPALREWFGHQQAFDAAVSAKLNSLPAPAGLREAILAGGRVTTLGAVPRVWWRQPMWLAAAASLAVICATGLVLWPRPALAGATLAEHILADTAHHLRHLGHGGPGTDALQALLADPTHRFARGLPVSYDALRRAGCRTISYQGRELVEVCFNRDGVWFHAYIGRRADFPALAAAPDFAEKDGHSAVTWADQAHVYLVAGNVGRAALQRLL
jgi:hypothetical protein